MTRELVDRFFRAMNDSDVAAVPGLFAPEAEIVIGPNVAHGHDEIGEIVLQEGPPELAIDTRPTGYEDTGGGAVVPFLRTQVWRESGELAVEEELWVTFAFAGDRIARAELHQERP